MTSNILKKSLKKIIKDQLGTNFSWRQVEGTAYTKMSRIEPTFLAFGILSGS